MYFEQELNRVYFLGQVAVWYVKSKKTTAVLRASVVFWMVFGLPGLAQWPDLFPVWSVVLLQQQHTLASSSVEITQPKPAISAHTFCLLLVQKKCRCDEVLIVFQ